MSYRGFRGGAFDACYLHDLRAAICNSTEPKYDNDSIRFRVADISGPATPSLLAVSESTVRRREYRHCGKDRKLFNAWRLGLEVEQVARFAVVFHRHVRVDARRGDAGMPGSVSDFRQRPTTC